MRSIIICRGLPASGKSTWAKAQLEKEPKRWVRVNRDDLRSMLNASVYTHDSEEFVREVRNHLIMDALSNGYDVIVDDTNLVPKTVKKLHDIAQTFGDVKVIEKCFNLSVDDCIKRNALREGKAKVPDKVINDMARAAGIAKGRKLEDKEVYYSPKQYKGVPVQADANLQPAIICDIDGTLAIVGDRPFYDASRSDVTDTLNTHVASLITTYAERGWKIIFLTGREEIDRPPTERFLKGHLPNLDYVLLMRDNGDSRQDTVAKREIYESQIAGKYDVRFTVEDRPRVCRMWRDELGIFCYQVAHREF